MQREILLEPEHVSGAGAIELSAHRSHLFSNPAHRSAPAHAPVPLHRISNAPLPLRSHALIGTATLSSHAVPAWLFRSFTLPPIDST